MVTLPARKSRGLGADGNPLETALLLETVRALNDLPYTVAWRMNTGALKDERGRLIRYGLCHGASDIICISRGRFVAIEMKRPGGRVTEEQERFLSVVHANMGLGGVARSVEEALEVVR